MNLGATNEIPTSNAQWREPAYFVHHALSTEPAYFVHHALSTEPAYFVHHALSTEPAYFVHHALSTEVVFAIISKRFFITLITRLPSLSIEPSYSHTTKLLSSYYLW